jgi:putative tricarboxylic transport membrane protein
MDHVTDQGQRSGRIAAIVVILFGVLLAAGASQIEYAFSSDPLGPRAFPYLLAGAFVLFGVWYLLRPGSSEPWPDAGTLVRSVMLIGVTTAAILVMPAIGFVASAAIICGVTASLFGATPFAAVGIGLGNGVFWFVIFKYGLGTYLPLGSLLFPGR